MSDVPVELEWLTDDRFRVGDTEFVRSFGAGSTAELFHIRKDRELVEAYVEMLRSNRGAAVVELGIADGGSVALLELVAAPSRLVALELDAAPVTALTDFIERRGIGDRVRPHYGIDQGDRERVLEVVTDELRGAPLDLVIDDASHLLEPTRSSFDALFPLLRPGGRYLIEDWSWQYQYGVQLAASAAAGSAAEEALDARLQGYLEQPDSAMHEQFGDAIAARLDHSDPEVRVRMEAELARRLDDPEGRTRLKEFVAEQSAIRHGRDRDVPTGAAPLGDGVAGAAPAAPAGRPRTDPDLTDPLPALAIDLMLARATSGEVVADVHIDEFWIWATRGPAELDPATFRLTDSFIDDQGLQYR